MRGSVPVIDVANHENLSILSILVRMTLVVRRGIAGQPQKCGVRGSNRYVTPKYRQSPFVTSLCGFLRIKKR